MTVNWLMIEISDASGKVTYRNSFITDLDVGRDNVAELAAAGRARWKIENESFNVLKTKGYNLEHNFGHGKAASGDGARDPQSAGLRLSYRLRTGGQGLACGEAGTGDPPGVLPEPADHHHLSRVPVLG